MRRSPLVVLPEASFPDRISAPWSRRQASESHPASGADDNDAEEKDLAGAVASKRNHASDPERRREAAGYAPKTMPVVTLPLPLVPLASDLPTSSGAGVAVAHLLDRDVDVEVGAAPDTLRRLGMLNGDLVSVTAPLSGETRVGRLVAAERWRRPRRGGIGENDPRVVTPPLSPGVLYLPPGMARNLSLHLQTQMMLCAAATKTKAGADAAGKGTDGAAGVETETETHRLQPQVIVARVAARRPPNEANASHRHPTTTTRTNATTTIRRAASIAVAPVRTPAPALPAPPSAMDPWLPGGAAESALGEGR